MQTDYQVLELFPIPIFATTLSPHLGSILPFFYQQEMLDDEEVDSVNYGERSKNSYILDEPECIDLKNHILELVGEYSYEILGYDYKQYKFGQSWISYKHPGQHHTLHSHPNSLISGVFYFGEITEDTPSIKFHNSSMGVNVPTIRPKFKKSSRNYSHEHFSINASPGLLLLFPSYLHHSVPVNKSNTTRCSLAFNTVPIVGFGEEESLTELKF
jgi:uncharacterized protein (TIGR02466 family)